MLNIYSADDKGPFKLEGFHDPDNLTTYPITYRPDAWVADTVYFEAEDIVIPTTFSGFYHKCTSAGTADSSEPTWATVAGEETVDNTVVWEAVAYNLLKPGVNVSSSSWVAADLVTITAEANDTTSSSIQVTAVPDGVKTINITNSIVLSNGDAFDVTIQRAVAER